MAQVQVIFTAEVHLTIDLPDSKLKSLIVESEIDFQNYLDITVQPKFTQDFPKCTISQSDIYPDGITLSSWESIYKKDLTELNYDGYKLTKI
jgi:hypothetical protein